MILFFDTETTGFIDKSKPEEWPGQPHLVQLACLLTERDTPKVLAEVNLIVKPEGWEIPAAAREAHGISTELAARVGVPLKLAVATYVNLRALAVELVAHNIDFDRKVMGAAIARCGRQPTSLGPGLDRQFCTIRMTENIVRLPPTDRMVAAGFKDKFKAPTLQEAHKYFFGEEFEGAHDAMADCRACMRLYFAAREVARAAVS